MSELILSAEEKQLQMNVERTFMKNLFESAFNNQFIIFYELLINYAATNHITIDDVLLQFKDGKKRTAFHFACQSSTSLHTMSTATNNTTIKSDDIKDNDDSYIDNNDIVSRIIFFHQYNNDDLMAKTLTKNMSQSLPWISNHTIHQLIRSKDSDGLTPLMLACQCTNSILCQSRTVALLKFAKVITPTTIDSTTSNKKLATKLTVARSKIGATALHYAAANDSTGITSRTIEALYNDAPIALRTNSTKGGTPLHWACSVMSISSSHIEIIQTLILLCKNHILENDIVNQYDNTIPPALFVCIATNHIENAKCFIENCIEYKINIIPTLQYYLKQGNINIFHMIVDQNMISILFILIEYLQTHDKIILLNHLLSSHNNEGEIPLDVAAREKHIGCVMMLLQYNNEQEKQRSNSNNNTGDDNQSTIEESTAIRYVEEYHQNKNNSKQKEILSQQHEEQQINDSATTTSDSLPTKNDDNLNSILHRYDRIVKAKCVELLLNSQSIETQQHDNNKESNTSITPSLKDIGNQYYQNKEYINAIDSYTKAIDLDPINAILYSNRSVCYLLLNEQMTPTISTDDDNDKDATITPPTAPTTITSTDDNTNPSTSNHSSHDDKDDNNKINGVNQPLNGDDTTSTINSSSYIELALYDALMSKELNPQWSKPYYRIATSLYDLKEYEDAAVIAWEGLSFVENQSQSSSTTKKSQYHTEKNDLQILLQKCVKKGRNEHLSTLQSSKSSVATTTTK